MNEKIIYTIDIDSYIYNRIHEVFDMTEEGIWLNAEETINIGLADCLLDI